MKPNVGRETLSENRWVSLGILIQLVVQGKQCFLMAKRSEVIRSTQPTSPQIFISELTLLLRTHVIIKLTVMAQFETATIGVNLRLPGSCRLG